MVIGEIVHPHRARPECDEAEGRGPMSLYQGQGKRWLFGLVAMIRLSLPRSQRDNPQRVLTVLTKAAKAQIPIMIRQQQRIEQKRDRA
jgi:hypothetical protein